MQVTITKKDYDDILAVFTTRVIAVDFDGCLCEDKWPGIGKANMPAIDLLIREREKGTKVILWTCRVGELLETAVKWCAGRGLTFDAVNENLPERIAQHGGDCRKINADEYWDDKAVLVVADEQQEKPPWIDTDSRKVPW